MAMVTATILATPNLGTSVTKGIARIIGVFVGACAGAGRCMACACWLGCVQHNPCSPALSLRSSSPTLR
jgi:uncharacterized membrane protein YccC